MFFVVRPLGFARKWTNRSRVLSSLNAVLQPPTPRSEQEVRNYIRNLRVIDNQRILTGLSQRLEPKRS